MPERLTKHARLNWQSLARTDVPSPPFLILFINSLCNMKCEHCFYWQQLNQRDDLTFEEIVALSEELGPIENLNLSGGEPFLRKEFAAICRQFIKKNGVKEIYVPTQRLFHRPDNQRRPRRARRARAELFGVELSLDGMPAFHDEFRKTKNSFRRRWRPTMRSPSCRRRIRGFRSTRYSTATEQNMAEIRQL